MRGPCHHLFKVNSFSTFKQSGETSKAIVQGPLSGVFGIAVKGFFTPEAKADAGTEEERFGMRRVLDVDLGRRWASPSSKAQPKRWQRVPIISKTGPDCTLRLHED